MHKYLLTIFVALLLTQAAFAHDILKTLSKEDLTEVQVMLVKEGYLVMPEGAEFGIYGPLTEKAFDKYQADRDRQVYAERKDKATTTPQKLGFFGWIWASIKSWF